MRSPTLRLQTLAAFLLFLAALALPNIALAQMVPGAFTLDEAASKAIAADWLTDAERREMRVFHGVWDARDLTTPTLRATVALNAWQLDDPSLADESVPAELRAQAKIQAGELEQAIALLQDARSNHAALLRAQAYEDLGQIDQANKAVDDPVKKLQGAKATDPGELTDGVQALFIRARIQGQPGRDFQTMLGLLARAHQEIDRLYWPAKLAEAELLIDKDKLPEAIGALHETLSLNPRSSRAWYLLGRVALDRFDFDSALAAAAALRRLNRQHPLADLLVAEERLIEDDPEGAQEILAPVLERFPKLRPALALHVAAEALLYDEQAMQAALDRYDQLSPNSAQAYNVAGRHLSLNRQYETAARVLEEAIRRQPAWPAPQIELGLMELQSGRDDRALAVLARVVKLDPFNTRAANSLFLLEEIASYQEIPSEHFIVRYKPGIDQVVAEMMPEVLERIHSIVSPRFNYEPPQKTLIELHPNHERFAVRITGMPHVHTIAACTGPVIALEVPREGPPSKHLGTFDWPRVIQHEYTHTITLGQTKNRIPHWLTEAAAVSMEPGPRNYDACQMLAESYGENTLFNLDEIKWAFVRPKRPEDRGKAYAQGHWMVEYMNERFGDSALVRLLDRYFAGEREQQAIPNTLGISREEFYDGFLEWAGNQVKAWGLGVKPTMDELADELRWQDPKTAQIMAALQKARLSAIVNHLGERIGSPASGRDEEFTASHWRPIDSPPIEITDETLAKWMEEYPDHPDLLEENLRRRIKRVAENEDAAGATDEVLVGLLERYAQLRPVDPFPHKKLAQIWRTSTTPQKAIEHLEYLDIREDKSPVYAIELAKLYRQAGDLQNALAKAVRAVQINPYNAPNRELAASIAMESNKPELARRHIFALTLLEPDRPQHARRLQAIDRLIAGIGQ
ncbi:MAG: tetratricopeptide repeat protein [Phycisphaerales bacterium]|nr:tetratricopeptide repeat protein [Phycisphaerales bacterium]